MLTYLVTGTSSGIGLWTAKYLLGSGAVVVGVSRRATDISHDNFRHIQGDLADAATVNKVKTAVGAALNGAVFNAGVFDAVETIAEADVGSWKHVFDVNVFSQLALTQAVLPALRQAKGRAVYVSSGAAKSSTPAWGAYGASKAALDHFVLTLANEEKDIVAVSVAPGVVETDMQARIRDEQLHNMSPEVRARFVALHKNGELVKPRDSGRLFGNLAQKADSELSGKVLRYSDEVLKKYNEGAYHSGN